MKKYKHIFFDLDRTIWDFEMNSKETLEAIFEGHSFEKELGISSKEFITNYKFNNDQLWEQYRNGEVDKTTLRMQRFYRTLASFGLKDEGLALRINDEYVASCSSRKNLIPNSLDLLNYLSEKYTLHIITNGFVEAQYVKLESSGIRNFFDKIIVSDEFGYRKPDSRIFKYALEQANAAAEESVMIGDDYGPDVLGAKKVGMDQVFFCQKDKEEDATYCVNDLMEVKTFL